MTASKRALAALAAGALALPLSPFATPAFADHINEQPIDSACPEDAFTQGGGYDDVEDDNLFAEEIGCITEYGFAQGKTADTFDPAGFVLRRQMALFIYRVGLEAGVDFDTTTDPGFDDDGDLNGEARDAVWGLANAGVVLGVTDDTFVPNGLVSRGQMASFIARIQDEIGVEDGFDADGEDFFDDDEGSVHEGNINRIAAEGITIGRGGDRLYAPLANVTREQMAAFIARKANFLVEAGFIEPIGDGTTPPPPGPDFDDIQVTPDDAVTLDAVANPDTDATDNRVYNVSGLEAGVEYRITLVQASLISTNGAGDLVFTDSDDDNLAEVGTRTADITSVNGAAPQNNTGDGTASTPNDVNNSGTAVFTATGSTATFTVDGDADGESVRPVVYRNGGGTNEPEEGGTNARLELNDDGTAAEAVDAGGAITFQQAASATATAGPELTGVAITALQSPTNPANGIVTYTFDEDVTGQAGNPALFHLYRFDATNFNATNVRIEGNRVIAEFPSGQLQNITVGTVDYAAVADVSGQFNPEGAEGLQNVTQAAGITSAPDLVSVGNFQTDINGNVTVDFVFDEAVADANPAPNGFELVLNDGTFFLGQSARRVANDGDGQRTVRVTFAQNSTQLPQSQVSRGLVFNGVVRDGAGNDNVLQAADVNFSGNTVEPDLVSARSLGENRVEYTFDQPVSSRNDGTNTPPSDLLDENRFRIYDADSQETFGANSVTRSQTDARVVVATFPAGTVQRAVGASVDFAAVRATENENQAGFIGFNQEDEVALQQVAFEAGRTTDPDLIGVRVLVDPVTQNRVVRYTFDENVQQFVPGAPGNTNGGADDFAPADFRLYDANNTQFTATGGVTRVSGDNNSVDVVGGFTNSQVDAAAIGTVNDSGTGNPQGGQVDFPEGDAPVQR